MEVKLSVVICMHVDIYVYSIVYIYDLSDKLTLSAYVWRVRSTREQMLMMQVALV